MNPLRLAALVVVALFAAACSTGATSGPSSPGPNSPGLSAAGLSTRIAVKLTDALKMEPAELHVPLGQPVTFMVTNAGANDHEFYLGDEAAQMKHESEMASMAGMASNEANGFALKPGETKELTMTFDTPGMTIAGCHTTGHYAAGMKATITIGG